MTTTCATCTSPTVGKSKYCAPHRDAAREAFLQMIKDKPSAADKAKAHAELYAKAHEAGMAAAELVTPVVMVVEEHENMFDDSSPVVARDIIRQGACGFGWVNVRPGNSSFAKWVVKVGRGRVSSYEGGVNIRCNEFGQSYELKSAYVYAFAGVLTEAGIRAYAQTRMD